MKTVILAPAGPCPSLSYWKDGQPQVYLRWESQEDSLSRVRSALLPWGSPDRICIASQPLRETLALMLSLPWPGAWREFRGLLETGPWSQWERWRVLDCGEFLFLPSAWNASVDPWSFHQDIMGRWENASPVFASGTKALEALSPVPGSDALQEWAKRMPVRLDRKSTHQPTDALVARKGGAVLHWSSGKRTKVYPGSDREIPWQEEDYFRLWEPRDLWPYLQGKGFAAAVVGDCVLSPLQQ